MRMALASSARQYMRRADQSLAVGRAALDVYQRTGHQGASETAEEAFQRAARLYLAGGIRRSRSDEADVATFLDAAVEMVRLLDHQLRAEAHGALQSALYRVRQEPDDWRASLKYWHAVAEDLRDRFARAAPELFDRPPLAARERMDHARDR